MPPLLPAARWTVSSCRCWTAPGRVRRPTRLQWTAAHGTLPTSWAARPSHPPVAGHTWAPSSSSSTEPRQSVSSPSPSASLYVRLRLCLHLCPCLCICLCLCLYLRPRPVPVSISVSVSVSVHVSVSVSVHVSVSVPRRQRVAGVHRASECYTEGRCLRPFTVRGGREKTGSVLEVHHIGALRVWVYCRK